MAARGDRVPLAHRRGRARRALRPAPSRRRAPRAWQRRSPSAPPEHIRGGLFFQGRLDIVAHERIAKPRVVLGPGWTEELQLNTLEPAPASETSAAGQLELEYDPLQAGDHLTVWMQFEANPTGMGSRDRSVTLLDSDLALVHVPGRLTLVATGGLTVDVAAARHRRLRPVARRHARGRPPRAQLDGALRPHPARRHRRPHPAGRHAERLLADRHAHRRSASSPR